MESQLAFTFIVALLAGQRLWELRRSARHEARLRAEGARESGAAHFGAMKALHTLWFAAMLAEVFLLTRPFVPMLAAGAMVVAIAGQLLRRAAMQALGPRWTARVLTVPGGAPITHGIYRHVRHPNYLGVVLELAAAPLIHTAYLTSIVFSLLNAALLAVRIRVEDRALATDYRVSPRWERTGT
jgi:methyltransferase